jgi:hypothetical protein
MFDVVVNTGTLARSSLGGITGVVYLHSAEEDFPEEHWSDFPVVVLAWWINDLHKITSGTESSCVCNCMDGRYTFVLKREDGSTVRVAWGRRGEEKPIMSVDVLAFECSAVTAGQRVLAAFHAKGWSGVDLKNLEQAIARSERSVK